MTATARLLGVLRDLLIVAVGILVLVYTPPSIEELGAAKVATYLWAVLLLTGGTISAAGLALNRYQLEVVGTFTAASGFTVWAVAAVATPQNLVSYAVGGVFLTLALSLFLRGLVVAAGLLPATRSGG